MNLGFDAQSKAMKLGNLAGWALGFFTSTKPGAKADLLLTGADYYASVEAALPGDLSGGRFSVTIDSLTDPHYTAIAAMKGFDLYLFWEDANASLFGNLKNLAGIAPSFSAEDLAPALIARAAITRVRRRPGARGYETTIEGRDFVFDRLTRSRAQPVCYPTIPAALKGLGDGAAVTVVAEPQGAQVLGSGTPDDAEITDAAPWEGTYLTMLKTMAARVADGLRGDAPSVVLLREGKVHLGRRPIPFPAGSTPVGLDASGGLAETTLERPGGEDGGAAAHWKLLCKGRPDIKPGAVVQFTRPPEDVTSTKPSLGSALLGSLSAIAGIAAEKPDTSVYVTDVVHRQSRTAGFQTEIAGVELPFPAPADIWALFKKKDGEEAGAKPPTSPDVASAVGKQVRDAARAALGTLRFPEVGEVRAATVKTAGPPKPPAQTVTLWEGVLDADGAGYGARSLPIRRDKALERPGVPTVTPFAWGQCGLVVPRYPGMRVALAFRNGKQQDPMEIGALWGDGARMQSEPGDWWLCLPVDEPTADLKTSDTSVHEPQGQTVHDLTDAAGTRIIQAGKLTIRVGKDGLPTVGTRPKASAPAVSIEHADGKASITIDAEGKITITGKTIAIDAGGDGAVTINAKTVDVTVGDKMTVT